MFFYHSVALCELKFKKKDDLKLIKQIKVKKKYYEDKVDAGPLSRILPPDTIVEVHPESAF